MSCTQNTVPLDALVELCLEKVASYKDPELRYVGLEHLAAGRPKLLGTLPSSASVSINSVFAQNDILFGKLRPNLRKSLRAPFPGYCSTDILVLRARDGIRPDFAGHLFQWEPIFASAAASAAGTKMPRTSWGELKRYPVRQPDSEGEQARIAALLDTADKAIAKTEAVIAKLRQMRTGLIHDLLTCGLDKNGRLRDPIANPDLFRVSPLGAIPVAWDCDELRCHTESSAYGPRFPGESYSQYGNVALLRTTDLDDQGNLALEQMPLAELPLEVFRPHFLETNDFLISRSGTCGIGAVFTGFRMPVLPGAFLIRFRLKSSLLPQFLRLYVNSEVGAPRVRDLAEGGVQKNIRGTALLAHLIPVPSPGEQAAILRITASVDAELSHCEQELVKFRQLKSGLMDDLLTGRVRVPSTP